MPANSPATDASYADTHVPTRLQPTWGKPYLCPDVPQQVAAGGWEQLCGQAEQVSCLELPLAAPSHEGVHPVEDQPRHPPSADMQSSFLCKNDETGGNHKTSTSWWGLTWNWGAFAGRKGPQLQALLHATNANTDKAQECAKLCYAPCVQGNIHITNMFAFTHCKCICICAHILCHVHTVCTKTQGLWVNCSCTG